VQINVGDYQPELPGSVEYSDTTGFRVASRASPGRDSHGRRKRRAGAAGVVEALDDVPSVDRVGVEEPDLSVDRNPVKRERRTRALRLALVR
jgi:hypothetical protein